MKVLIPRMCFAETKPKRVTAEPNDPLFHMQLGQQAMLKALRILEDKDGWEVRFKEVTAGFSTALHDEEDFY